MATFRKYAWLLTATVLLLPGCDLSSDPISTRVWAIGTTQRLSTDTTQWWFLGDNSKTYYPHERTGSSPRSGVRVTAVMELVDTERPGYDYVVKMLELSGVVTNSVTSTSQQTIDTMKNNDIWISSGFVSSHYLNLVVTVMGLNANESPHSFYLLRDSTQTTSPVKLILRHDLNGDSPYYTLNGTLSFDLETLTERGAQDSVAVLLMTPKNGNMNFTYIFQ
ncbi:MAG: NigD-like protein [Prevotellaceae bacterium]|nr:NigD-like protein [Prevotellaceae bacterium]